MICSIGDPYQFRFKESHNDVKPKADLGKKSLDTRWVDMNAWFCRWSHVLGHTAKWYHTWWHSKASCWLWACFLSVFANRNYLVTVVTSPGGGIFEATVRVDEKWEKTIGQKANGEAKSEGARVEGSISRLNLYGNSSWCIKDQQLRLYCYCKDQKPSLSWCMQWFSVY